MFRVEYTKLDGTTGSIEFFGFDYNDADLAADRWIDRHEASLSKWTKRRIRFR